MKKFKLPFALVLLFSFFCLSFTDARARIVDTIEALKEKKIGTEEANIEIYPNPSSSNLIVRTELQIHDFRLINTAGCEVKCPSLASVNGLQLDVTGLDKGFYILDLKTEYQNIRKPLLIE